MSSGTQDLRRNLYHLVFVSKCRYKVFRNEFTKKVCTDSFHEVEQKYGVRIEELEFQEDHVHLMVHIPARLSVSFVIQLLKGVSARRIFDASPKLHLRYPRGSFWSRFKYYGTVGPMTVDAVRRYIGAQDVHHETLISPEAGQTQLTPFFS
ncbi:MAG: IS200/IS605 family transposase [Candidatus Micrarchaeota archaeon]